MDYVALPVTTSTTLYNINAITAPPPPSLPNLTHTGSAREAEASVKTRPSAGTGVKGKGPNTVKEEGEGEKGKAEVGKVKRRPLCKQGRRENRSKSIMKLFGFDFGMRGVRWSDLAYWHSPLELRRSASLAAQFVNWPWLFVLRLLWPFPWRYATVTPDTPRELMASPDIVEQRYRDIYQLRIMPLWRFRDTSQRSFYRLYEAYCASDDDRVGFETEYFWKHAEPSWATHLLPDPRDSDPERYAVLASLAEELVDSFNWRLEMGMRRNREFFERAADGTPQPFVAERVPDWCQRVSALDGLLVLHSWPGFERLDGSPVFLKRNIKAGSGALRTI